MNNLFYKLYCPKCKSEYEMKQEHFVQEGLAGKPDRKGCPVCDYKGFLDILEVVEDVDMDICACGNQKLDESDYCRECL